MAGVGHGEPPSAGPTSRSAIYTSDIESATPTAAQERILTAAVQLFARRGVGGTSLQMIADEIGVTKAAVYHQYKTKDEIVLAAAETELAKLAAVIDVAEREPTDEQSRDAAVSGIVDLAIESRTTAGSILGDPVVVGFFAEHQLFRNVMRRVQRLLIGDRSGPQPRVQTAVLIAALSGAVTHPLVANLDDEVLRVELLRMAQRLIESE